MVSLLQNRETTSCLALLRLSQLCASLNNCVCRRNYHFFRLRDFRVVSHALSPFGSVNRIQTRSVHHEQHSLRTKTDHICACGSRASRLKNCSVIIVRMNTVSPLVRHVISLLVSSTSSHFQSTTTHEAPPGQYDLLRDDTVHRAPLPEPIQSTSSANEPLSHVNDESGRNPRKTSSTG